MQTYYIPHKLKVGDTTNLSDTDSQYLIQENKLYIEDIVKIETYEKIYLAQITNIEKNSVEVEIMEEIGERKNPKQPTITIIQSISNDSKFNFFLEKSVEIGIEKIIPIESTYSIKKLSKAKKDFGLWKKIINDATEQSRNTYPTILEKPINIQNLNQYNFSNTNNICLSLQNCNPIYLENYLKQTDITKPFVVAIGPEKGWSKEDIDILSKLNFKYIKLKGNILRTETTGLVIGSILKYLKGEI